MTSLKGMDYIGVRAGILAEDFEFNMFISVLSPMIILHSEKTLGPYSVAMHSSYLLRLKLLAFLFIHRACVKLSVLTRY